MIENRRYNEPIKIPSQNQVIHPEDEILFQEIQTVIDYKKNCPIVGELDSSEFQLNRNYLAFVEQFEEILSDDNFLVKLYHFSHFKSRLELIRRCKEDKISISVISDKYGNKYLKAKAAFPIYTFVDGKKKTNNKTISVHLGKLDDYKEGINDKIAKSKARGLLLHKAKLMMESEQATSKTSKDFLKKLMNKI